MTNEDDFSVNNSDIPGIEYRKVDRSLIGMDELNSRFGFHKATIEGAEATQPIHAQLRHDFLAFADYLDRTISNSREKSLAFTHLEEASMWAHKAVAKNAPLEKD